MVIHVCRKGKTRDRDAVCRVMVTWPVRVLCPCSTMCIAPYSYIIHVLTKQYMY